MRAPRRGTSSIAQRVPALDERFAERAFVEDREERLERVPRRRARMRGERARGRRRDAGGEGRRRRRSRAGSQDTPQGGEEDLHEMQGVGPAFAGGGRSLVHASCSGRCSTGCGRGRSGAPGPPRPSRAAKRTITRYLIQPLAPSHVRLIVLPSLKVRTTFAGISMSPSRPTTTRDLPRALVLLLVWLLLRFLLRVRVEVHGFPASSKPVKPSSGTVRASRIAKSTQPRPYHVFGMSAATCGFPGARIASKKSSDVGWSKRQRSA